MEMVSRLIITMETMLKQQHLLKRFMSLYQHYSRQLRQALSLCFLFFLYIYAIGEIISQLTQINNNTDKRKSVKKWGGNGRRYSRLRGRK